MKIFKSMLFAVIAMLFGVVPLASCGGGGGGGSVAQPTTPVALPPDPGAQGDTTLAGVDSNNNDVRDDVERAIHARHSGNAHMRTMLMNLAEASQTQVMAGDSGNDVALNRAAAMGQKAVECLGSTVGAFVALDEIRFIASAVVNTDARYVANDKFNTAMNNRVFGDLPGNPCE